MARTTLLLAAPPHALPHLLLLLLLLFIGTAADTTTITTTTTSEQQAASPPSSSSSLSEEKKTSTSTSASTTPTSNTTLGFYKGMSREFVKEHNKVRARYGAHEVEWDKTLALHARRWAAQVQQDCDKARHSPTAQPLGYGECFFVGNNGTAEDALCSWEKEELIYDKSKNECTSGHDYRDCGHFIIMIDKSWRYVGCGRAPCLTGPRRGQFFISCNYSILKPNATTSSKS